MVLYQITGALVSSALISPIMTCIDISIIQSQIKHCSFKKSLLQTNIGLLNGSLPFRKPFLIMNLVYSSTYLTANLTEHY